MMKGGCACGAVRYALRSAPRDPAWCHCRICQLNSGSLAMAFATVPAADLSLEAGEDIVRGFASSEAARRHFCGKCGTPLYVADLREPGDLYVSLATLDDPAAVPPGFPSSTPNIFPGLRRATTCRATTASVATRTKFRPVHPPATP